MRLFSFITSPERHDYLWVLRAIDHARANYQVVLSTEAVAQALDALAERGGDCPRGDEVELAARLDALDDWGVLDRTQDAARAATLAEYRRRHSVYQFTEAGHRAFTAVESVLGAKMEETSLSRTVFADLLEDLEQLAAANRGGDGDTVLRRFKRIDSSLNEVAEQAARFYAMLGDLTRTTEVNAAIFQTHKDALISHLRDFHNELQRYSPLLYEAATAVEETGIDRLVGTAAEQDDRPFGTFADRLADWRRRWEGVKAWLAPPSVELGSEVDRLSHATFNAISDITGMVRQLADARRGGVSRESQLRHLAAWFVNAPTMAAAHALYDVVFDLSGPLHVNRPHEEPEIHPTSASWWDTEAVELSKTLLEKGRSTGNRDTRGAKVRRDEATRRQLQEHQMELVRKDRESALAMTDQARDGFAGTVLDDRQLGLLLRLIDKAVAERHGPLRHTVSAASHGIRLSLTPADGDTVVSAKSGTMRLAGLSLAVERVKTR
ncbi:TIGR02677 family protein [Glycomyces buryatensis]|uniref:TIGR02677 family protein n=2 Tax=Glycomyces buryatensis TaxID=2570927 RepID=A0A4S8QCE9_9ACTN|nr:TIGR02677 family protein [Glycomyces buryatensis]